eukprot:Opistho-2@89715
MPADDVQLSDWFQVRRSNGVSTAALVELTRYQLKFKQYQIPDVPEGPRVVKVTKSNTGLDFSIKGGSDHKLPILISRIFENGAAARTNLKCGDEILEVNGTSMEGLTHEKAVDTLKRTGNLITLKVRFNATAHQRLCDALIQANQRRNTMDPSRRSSAIPGLGSMTEEEAILHEIMSVPLVLSAVSRNGRDGQIERDNSFRVIGGDGNEMAILAKDPATCELWVSAIQQNLATIAVSGFGLAAALAELPSKRAFGNFTGKFIKVGWVWISKGNNEWSMQVAGLTDHDLSLYDHVPRTPDAANRPIVSHPLLEIRPRQLEAGLQGTLSGNKYIFTFVLPNGDLAQYGVETAEEAVEWHRVLTSAFSNSAKTMGSVVYSGRKGESGVTLEINYDTGLRLFDAATQSVMWQHEFGEIVASWNNSSLLRLDFAHPEYDGTQDIELKNPRAAVHALVAMLQAKVEERQTAIAAH